MPFCVVVWWNEETKPKEGNNPPLPQEVEDMVHARNRRLAEAVNLIEFLVVQGDPNAFRLLRDDHQLEYGEVEGWIRPAARY